MPQLSLHSPIGPLTLSEEDGMIVALDTGWGRDQTRSALLRTAADQLQAYFDGRLQRFDLPLAPIGTVYRRRVWQHLRDIPFGHTLTYAGLAARAGGVARSIGQALGANPVPILIPCHRVLAARGLGGFSMEGGDETKRYLLRLEGVSLDHP